MLGLAVLGNREFRLPKPGSKTANREITGNGPIARTRNPRLSHRLHADLDTRMADRSAGLDDQPFTFFAHDGVFGGKLELAGDPHRLVSPVLEELDVSFGNHDRLRLA
jgi:hypothetical protein